MEYTIFLQPRESGGFVASAPAIPGCQSHGTTEEEAIRNISVNIKDFLQKTKVVRIKVDGNGTLPEDPWDEVIGMFAGDETFDDFQNEIKKYRNHKTTWTL
jgi:predicted RNase H-like HicB family nuclease